MSIPVDFVGLNTLLVKQQGIEKNHLTGIKESTLKVDVDLGSTVYELTDVLKYETFEEYKANHVHDGVLQNCTIEIKMLPIDSTVGNFGDSNVFETLSIINAVNNRLQYGGVGGGHLFSLQNSLSNQRRLHERIEITDSNTLRYESSRTRLEENTSATVPSALIKSSVSRTSPLSLILVFGDRGDPNLYRSSKSGKLQSQGIKSAIFVNGEYCQMDELFFKQMFDHNNLDGHSSPRIQFGSAFSKGLDSAFADETEFRIRHADSPGKGSVENNLAPVGLANAQTTIYSVAFWKKALTQDEITKLASKPKEYFFKKNNSLMSEDKAIPKEDFLILGEVEKNLNILSSDHKLGGFKNSDLANIQTNSTIFSALMNNTNGPYGYSSFKQLRASQNWLVRSYNKNNTFSFVSEKGKTITNTKNGKILSTHKTKYGDIQNLTETPVSEQHYPLEMIATVSDGFDDEKLLIKGAYSNETQFFKNKVVNVETSRELSGSETYEDLKSLVDNDTTPLKSFDKLTYKQSVFPKNLYTHSRNHRTRPIYSSKIWRDERASRTELDLNNGFGYYTPSQSFWPLDAEENFTTLPTTNYYGGALGYNSSGAAGVLQNSYSLFATSSTLSGVEVDNVVTASILYSRPHTLTSSTSVKNPFFTNLSGGVIGNSSKFTGHAKWEAGDMAGFFNTDGNFQLSPKQPFPDSYDEWAESFRGLGKGYSVVPEFRISDHVNHYLTNGFTSQKLDFLDVKGGNQDYAKSSDQDFFKVYSTTDFLKNFEVVKEDFENKATPTGITLRCKAIKKFLPYEGFYPCQRTVDLSKQFYDSYGFFVSGSSWSTTHKSIAAQGVADLSSTSKYVSQNLIAPLFSPGILFNSIKSGIACDFPVYTYPFSSGSKGEQFYITSEISKRLPFEALMEPEKHLSNLDLYSMDPDPKSPKVKSSWTGQGDELYKLMINNFVSEVGDFFLENERHTTITSLPEGDPNFGNVQPGKVYGMRIKMFRSITGSKGTETSHDDIVYGLPQDNGQMGESFTMYSRPSGFGPNSILSTDDFTSNNFKASTWSKFKFAGSLDFSYEDYVIPPATTFLNTGSIAGYNFSFTPPYYHGEAWADVFFKPPEGGKKYSLSDVINNSSVEFYRYYLSSSSPTRNISDIPLLINDQSMQIASSVNIFSRGILQEDSEGLTINTQLETKYRWIIQSKWETPTLNFNHLSHEDLTMPPSHATSSVPIGMWHQYGRLPQRTDEGIFIQVTDIPTNWIEGAMDGDTNNTGSLVDLCGFSTDPIRVGEIKNTKTVEEAVVAIPFVNRNGFREFFKLNKQDVRRAINGIEEAVGPTVFKLTQQLDKYVFPPQFDYKRNKDIEPAAMYVFEFSHEFTKQDLADIWQNLPPELGESHETAEATVSHALFSEEFLGTGADPKKTANGIERNIVSELTDLPSDIQWMVFKVKKRAKSNYFEKMFQRNESRDSNSNNSFTVDSTGKKTDVSFNWPYDFFSMVELIKLDAEVEFSNVDEDKSKQEKKLVTKPYIFRED